MSQPRKRSGSKRATSNSPSRPTCEDGTAGGGVDIEKLYRAIDFDGDGSLDVFEVSKGFEAMGITLTAREAAEVFAIMDADGNSKVTYKEFEAWMVSRDLLASRVRRLVLDPAAEAFPLLWKPVLVILLVINLVLAYRMSAAQALLSDSGALAEAERIVATSSLVQKHMHQASAGLQWHKGTSAASTYPDASCTHSFGGFPVCTFSANFASKAAGESTTLHEMNFTRRRGKSTVQVDGPLTVADATVTVEIEDGKAHVTDVDIKMSPISATTKSNLRTPSPLASVLPLLHNVLTSLGDDRYPTGHDECARRDFHKQYARCAWLVVALEVDGGKIVHESLTAVVQGKGHKVV